MSKIKRSLQHKPIDFPYTGPLNPIKHKVQSVGKQFTSVIVVITAGVEAPLKARRADVFMTSDRAAPLPIGSLPQRPFARAESLSLDNEVISYVTGNETP